MTEQLRSDNAFGQNKPGSDARADMGRAIEAMRQRGGIFVDVVRATRMAMALTDPALPGNPIVFANQAFIDLSGYSMEEVLGQQPYFMNGVGTDPEDAERFRRILESDRDGVVETVQYGKDGRRFVATVLLSAFKDEAGKTLYHFLSWADVTRRVDAESDAANLRAAQAALRESEAKYRTLFETMGQGFCELQLVRDDAGKAVDQLYLQLNPAFERLFGIPVSQAMGRRASDVFPGLERVWTETYDQVVRTAQPARIEHRMASVGRWFEVFAYPAGGDRVHVLYEEVTERKHAEVALSDSEEQLRDVLNSMTEGFALFDADFTILDVNAETVRLDGRTRGELVGSNHWKAFPGSEHSPLGETYKRVMRDRIPAAIEHGYRWPDGKTMWVDARVYPTAHGRIACLWRDVTDRKRAEAELRESEERQAFLLEFSDALRPLGDAAAIKETAVVLLGKHLGVTRAQYYEVDASGDYFHAEGGYTDGAPAVVGRYRLDAFGEFIKASYEAGRTLAVADVTADPRIHAAMHASYEKAGLRAFVGIPLVKGGRFKATLGLAQAAPRQWTAREIALGEEVAERTWAAVERVQAEAALRESEERLRAFGDASQDVLWIRDAETLQWTYLTPAFETIYGLEREQALSGDNHHSWLNLIEAEDRQHASDSIARARDGEHVTFEYRIRRPSDGAIRWLRNTDFPIRNSAGQVALVGGIGADITDRRQSEDRQKMLLAELQHRVRNILAVIRSIIGRSDDGERSTEDYVNHLQGRISALARTQVILTRSAGAGINLEDLVRDELVAQAVGDEQFSLQGPEVELSPKAAEVLTLAIHELATNATKYGAFSREGGRLRIGWEIEAREGRSWLSLCWQESGVAIVEPVPRRRGFGSDLISRRIPYELKGTGSFELKPGGLESRIEFPLRPGDSILQTSGVS